MVVKKKGERTSLRKSTQNTKRTTAPTRQAHPIRRHRHRPLHHQARRLSRMRQLKRWSIQQRNSKTWSYSCVSFPTTDRRRSIRCSSATTTTSSAPSSTSWCSTARTQPRLSLRRPLRPLHHHRQLTIKFIIFINKISNAQAQIVSIRHRQLIHE